MTENVSVIINGIEFAHWTELEIHLSLDALWQVKLTAPFEADRREFRDIFRPFTYKPLQVNLDGKRFFTGTLVGIDPSRDANERAVEVSAYALPGVLDDCTPQGSKFPVEFRKVKLSAIARALASPFGIELDLRADEGSPFDRVRLEEDKHILPFLVELAKQRNLVLSNTADGKLLCWRSVATGSPVAHLKGDEAPTVSVAGEFSPQEYYSELTCFSKTTRKKRGSQYTEKNKWLPDVLRPRAFRLEDTNPQEAPDATKAELGRMFGNMASWTIDHLPTWRDPQGNVWTPNTTINVTAPDAMIYRTTELLIRDAILKASANEMSADLRVVLPGAFSGEQPEHLPWEE